ncbi:hypothetical protein [Dysgonomonas massiliensis]|uniref:hypothetical protein n=1 Tax=Dysgonomonas massiliensis TaxID=2040292 RepID=UPI000C75EE23|nr:hypothetical protein [Dysgonomonas massiliensis]
MADNTKTFKIKIDGLEQSVQYTKLLADSFLAVDRNISRAIFSISQLRQGIQKTWGASIDLDFVKSFNKISSTVESIGKVSSKSFGTLKKDLSDIKFLEEEISKKSLAENYLKGTSMLHNNFKGLNLTIKETAKNVSELSEDEIKKLKDRIKELEGLKKKLNDEVDAEGKKKKPNEGYFDEKGSGQIQKLAGQAAVKGNFGIIDYDITRDNLNLVIDEYKKYKVFLDKQYEYEREINENNIELAKGNAEKYAAAIAAKEAADVNYLNKSIQVDNAILKSKQEKGALLGDAMESSVKAVTDYAEKLTSSIGAGLTFMKGASEARLAMIEEELKGTTEKYNKAVEARKASDAVLADLHNKSVNLSGGRSEAMQQQVDAEMAKNEELKAQEARLAAEKEKLEKKKEKETKKKKKIEIQQGIVTSTASIAQGIAKALSLGPIVGPIMAAMLAAMGAVQIATQYKQLQQIDRKADGGLLRGRRHSEGGMRIEGTNIEVEGGEYVINRRTTDHNMGLIRYINSQRRPLGEADMVSYFRSPRAVQTPPWRRQMEEGGALPVPQLAETMSRDNALLLNAIQNIRIDSRVAVTDIIRAQERMTEVDSWVGM